MTKLLHLSVDLWCKYRMFAIGLKERRQNHLGKETDESRKGQRTIDLFPHKYLMKGITVQAGHWVISGSDLFSPLQPSVT